MEVLSRGVPPPGIRSRIQHIARSGQERRLRRCTCHDAKTIACGLGGTENRGGPRLCQRCGNAKYPSSRIQFLDRVDMSTYLAWFQTRSEADGQVRFGH